jgi:long-chain acyl-CoA synthetase
MSMLLSSKLALSACPTSIQGEKVIAFVALRDGFSVDEQELRDLIRSRIADYKTPERILFLPVLPKGLTGKVQRRALTDLALASPEMTLAIRA